MGGAKLPLGPQLREFAGLLFSPPLRVAAESQEVLGGELDRLQVAHVDHPDPVGAILQRQVHLLPDFRNRIGVDPLVVTRAAHVVEMVVDPRPAGALAFVRSRQAADVAPIVVAPQQRHVVGHTHALFVVRLHFFIECPCLRDLGDVGIDVLRQNLPLIGHDLLQQLHVFIQVGAAHGHVPVAAHADGGHALEILVALYALGPEIFQHVGILGVVPHARAVPRPFLLCPQHRLVVRSAHHHAVIVSRLGIQRIVFVEGVVPHRRPHKVALQAKHQFEHLGVKLVVHIGDASGAFGEFFRIRPRSELLLHPAIQRRSFVVEEDAAILHRGRAFHVAPRLHEEVVLVIHRHVRPEVPGRHADLFGDVVDAVDGPALIAAGDHQRARHARQRTRHHLDVECLPLARDARHVDPLVADQLVDQRALADRADDNRVGAQTLVVVHHGCRHTRNLVDVRLQVARGAYHADPVLRVDVDVCGRFGCHDGKRPRGARLLDVFGLADRLTGPNCCEQAEARYQGLREVFTNDEQKRHGHILTGSYQLL